MRTLDFIVPVDQGAASSILEAGQSACLVSTVITVAPTSEWDHISYIYTSIYHKRLVFF